MATRGLLNRSYRAMLGALRRLGQGWSNVALQLVVALLLVSGTIIVDTYIRLLRSSVPPNLGNGRFNISAAELSLRIAIYSFIAGAVLFLHVASELQFHELRSDTAKIARYSRSLRVCFVMLCLGALTAGAATFFNHRFEVIDVPSMRSGTIAALSLRELTPTERALLLCAIHGDAFAGTREDARVNRLVAISKRLQPADKANFKRALRGSILRDSEGKYLRGSAGAII